MSFQDQRFGHCNKFETTFKKSTPEELKGLIQDLSLKERELELINSEKVRAIEKIMQLREIAIEPLIEALDNADLEAKGWIIYLLGELLDNRAIVSIYKYLNANEEKIRNSEGDALKNLDSREIRRLIKKAKQIETRNESTFWILDDKANKG